MSNGKDLFKFPVFVKGDIDRFIGLFIDNLVNLLLLHSGLCLDTSQIPPSSAGS